jgi:hypothetical protein
MSAWKLVEAVPEEEQTRETSETTEENTNNFTNNRFSPSGRSGGRGRGRSSGDGSGRGRGRFNSSSSTGGRSPTKNYPGPYRSRADRSYFSYLAVQQIDQIFNIDSLCMDTFIRSYMDEAGYVPVSLVCTYQNVAQFQCSYNDIVLKLKETISKCKNIELDADNETVRLKEGWEKVSFFCFGSFYNLSLFFSQFLMPNAFGGKGLPRYVKQDASTQQQNEEYYSYFMNPPAAAPGTAPGMEYYNPFMFDPAQQPFVDPIAGQIYQPYDISAQIPADTIPVEISAPVVDQSSSAVPTASSQPIEA